MEIFIQKLNSQHPIDEDQILELLGSGQLVPEDLACLRGMQEWKPLWALPGIPPMVREIFAMEGCLKAVDMKLKLWRRYEDNLLLRKNFEEEVEDWEKTVNAFNNKFPNHPLAISGQMYVYFYQAYLKINSNAFMIFDSDDNPITGAITLMQNENASEAIKLFDKAIELSDSPEFHLMKFEPLLYLERFEDADEEIDYVLANFADDEAACKEALRQREIVDSAFDE
jgi:tetratricopeptide (TPR) repeat protein